MTLDDVVRAIREGTLVSFDGVMSPTSRAIQDRLGGLAIDMKTGWLWTPQDWACPVCRRRKPDIARVGHQKQIVAHLVVHHDHTGDSVKQEFATAFQRLHTTTPQVEGQMLVDRLHGAFAAHEEVLVCEDCNNADAAAKKIVGAPSGFSFTPRQIRSFIRPAPNAAHRLDDDTVRTAWEMAKPLFDLRLALIQRIASAAASGAHWFERFDGTGRPIPNYLETPDARSLGPLGGEELAARLAPKLSFGRDLSGWRSRRHKPRAAPPENAVALVCSNVFHAKAWQEAGAAWSCPCCGRPRSAVVYMNKGKALPGVGRVGHRAAFGHDVRICSDCDSLLSSLREEARQLAAAGPRDGASWVQMAELRALIRHHQPHQFHEVDGGRALELLHKVAERFRQFP